MVSIKNNNAIERSYSLTTNCIEGNITIRNVSVYQYCCSTDLCNGSGIEKTNLIRVLISLVLSLVLIKDTNQYDTSIC